MALKWSGSGRAQQEAFDVAAGWSGGVQAGGNDGGVVAEKGVAGAHVVAQVAEMPVFQAVFPAVHDQQPGRIAPVRRTLGNQAFRERVVKKVSRQCRHVRNEGLLSPRRRVSSAFRLAPT